MLQNLSHWATETKKKKINVYSMKGTNPGHAGYSVQKLLHEPISFQTLQVKRYSIIIYIFCMAVKHSSCDR